MRPKWRDPSHNLAALGKLAREGDVEAAAMLEKVGRDIQREDQAGLDIAYEDFVRQRITPANSYSSCHPFLEVCLCSPRQRLQNFNHITLCSSFSARVFLH